MRGGIFLWHMAAVRLLCVSPGPRCDQCMQHIAGFWFVLVCFGKPRVGPQGPQVGGDLDSSCRADAPRRQSQRSPVSGLPGAVWGLWAEHSGHGARPHRFCDHKDRDFRSAEGACHLLAATGPLDPRQSAGVAVHAAITDAYPALQECPLHMPHTVRLPPALTPMRPGEPTCRCHMSCRLKYFPLVDAPEDEEAKWQMVLLQSDCCTRSFFEQYERPWRFWRLFELAQKFLIVCFTLFFTSVDTRVLGLMLITGVHTTTLIVLLRFMPYVAKLEDKMMMLLSFVLSASYLFSVLISAEVTPAPTPLPFPQPPQHHSYHTSNLQYPRPSPHPQPSPHPRPKPFPLPLPHSSPGGAIRTLTLLFYFYYGIHSLMVGRHQILRYLRW